MADIQIDVCEEPEQAEHHAEAHRKAGRKNVAIRQCNAIVVDECTGEKPPYELAKRYYKTASTLYIVSSEG